MKLEIGIYLVGEPHTLAGKHENDRRLIAQVMAVSRRNLPNV